MRAVNSIGAGNFSNIVFTDIIITTPSAPLSLAVSDNGDGSVLLEWEAPISDGYSAITDYQIYRGYDMDDLVYLATAFPDQLDYTDHSVVNNTRYFYGVK